ncbi:MAG: hypothetical protein AAB906_01675, partial [Patescibacteria group bacterium]
MSPEKPGDNELDNIASVAEKKRFLMLQAISGADEQIETVGHNNALFADAFRQTAGLVELTANDILNVKKKVDPVLKKCSYSPYSILEELPLEGR